MRAKVTRKWGIPIREKRSHNAKIVDKLAYGTEFEAVEEYDGWLYIEGMGWCDAWHTEPVEFGGGGGVSSWNDLTDKPFYEGEPVETMLFGESTVTTDSDGYAELGEFILEEGAAYTVTFNGTKYECVAWWNDRWSEVCIGNGTYAESSGKGNGEPFCIDFYEADSTAYLNASRGSHRISVSCMAAQIKEIESKYLPRATEEQLGVVRYGEGYNKAARVVKTYFGDTYEDFEKAYRAFQEEGVVWRIVDRTVLSATGSPDMEFGAELTIDDGGRENVVVVKGNPEDGITYMEMETRPVSEGRIPVLSKLVLFSSSGSLKRFEITVDDSGTIKATEVTS